MRLETVESIPSYGAKFPESNLFWIVGAFKVNLFCHFFSIRELFERVEVKVERDDCVIGSTSRVRGKKEAYSY